MILVAAVALTALTLSLAGGRLAALADLRFRGLWALWLALAVQIVIVSVIPDQFPAVHVPAHLGSYVLLAVFFALNARLPGVAIMAAGWLCNFAAIAANGGIMPASPAALRTAGIEVPPGFANSAAMADPNLAWLGDVFAVPASVPLANVFSVGDVLLVVGAAMTMVVVCRPRSVAPSASEGSAEGSRAARTVGPMGAPDGSFERGQGVPLSAVERPGETPPALPRHAVTGATGAVDDRRARVPAVGSGTDDGPQCVGSARGTGAQPDDLDGEVP